MFEWQCASYMWMFQMMPIGKARDTLPYIINSAQRVELYRKWEHLFEHKKYCIADFWNSGCVLDGCIAYGRWNGYFYIDWDGKIMHGSIRDHFENFKSNILSKGATPENLEAFQMLEDPDIEAFLVRFEKDLQQLTEKIWIEEYCREEEALLTG